MVGGRDRYDARMNSPKLGMYFVAALLLLVGLFYAFNAYIQLQERGFAEAQDIPIALIAIAIGAYVFWSARRR